MFLKKIPKLGPRKCFFLIIITVLFYTASIFWEVRKFSNLNWTNSNRTLTVSRVNHERIDWHDHEFILQENLRSGPGERSGYQLTDPKDIEENRALFAADGSYLLVSNRISVNRSLPDVRSEKYDKSQCIKHI